jgi:hypothetical protein
MKAITTPSIKRTNIRNGASYILAVTDDGNPKCPHCGAKMMLCGDVFENSFCQCWWRGANDINYYAQVVVHATDEAEAALQERRQARFLKLAAEREASKQRAEAARAALAGKKALTKLHFVADDFGTIKPRYMPEAVEVTIERCYVKSFDSRQGGDAEVMDVIYPDGRKFYIRSSQIEKFA